MILKRLLLAFTLVFLFGQNHAQNKTEIDLIDQYFELWKTQDDALTSLFTPAASISTITYDSAGKAVLKQFERNEYLNELRKTREEFVLWQEPVVLINRSYGYAANYYCSVFSRYVSKQTNDTLNFRSIQSFKLLYADGGWKIDHILIQFGALDDSQFNQDLWPDTLVGAVNKGFKKDVPIATFSSYNADLIYGINEVDEAPVAAGTKREYDQIKAKFGITQTEQSNDALGSPFLVLISEDGTPTLYYVNDLSGEQIKKAQEFTKAMSPWYPAIKDKASVKCKLKFYIR